MRRTARTSASLLTESLGWLGVVLITGSYVGTVLAGLSPAGIAYALCNALGSACILCEAWAKRDWQPVALNAVWLAVAFIALARNAF